MRAVGGGSQRPDTVTIGQFFAVLRRRWFVVLSCLLAGVALGSAAVALSAPSYTSRAVVTVSALEADPLNPSGNADVSTVTEANVVASSSVAERAAALMQSSASTSELLESLDVSSPLGSSVLEIEYTAPTAAGAAAGANAFAEAYLSYREDTARGTITLRIDQLEEQVGALGSQIEQAGVVIGDPATDAAERARLTTSRDLLSSQVDELRRQQTQLRTVQVVPGQLVDRGEQPPGDGAPPLVVFLAGGSLVGLLLGVALAVWRDRRDDLVSGAPVLATVLGVPVLASVPRPRHGPAEPEPLSPAEAESYHRLVAKLLAVSQRTGGHAVLLAGAGRPGTDHPLPRQVATTLAQQQLKVVLVCCTPAATATVEALGAVLPPAAHREADVRSALAPVRTAGASGFTLLHLGEESHVEGELFRRREDYLAVLAAADVVVLDGLNVQNASTVLSLAQITSGAVVVAEQWRSHGRDVRRLSEELDQVGAWILGGVLLVHGVRQPAGGRGRSGPHREAPVGERSVSPSRLAAISRHTGPDTIGADGTQSDDDLVPLSRRDA